MGGNAFKQLELVRVHRDDVPATVNHVVDTLDYPGLTREYAARCLMGSTGKKETSGDIDFCLNTHKARFVGEEDFPVFNKHGVLRRVREVLPQDQINSQTFKMGNLMMAWPVAGDLEKGYVQVDFVFGKLDLLQFTHYSPAEGESEFKGVFLMQGLGIIAKMQKYFEKRDPVTDERMGRVGLHLSLELGLFCSWESRRRVGMGCSKTTADEFETRFAECPRYPRIGYIDEPDAMMAMLFKDDTKFEDVNTFEKLVEHVRTKMPERYGEFWERFMESAGGSGIAKQNGYDPYEVAMHPVWKAKEMQVDYE